MSINPKELPEWAQKQILQKLAEQQRKKDAAAIDAQEPKKTAAKYHNVREDRGELHFDSKKEARRFDELMLLLKAGRIRDLKLQPQYTLQEAYTTPDGKRVRAIRYQADFSYEERYVVDKDGGTVVDGWRLQVEDVKSKATKTRVYAIKKKLMRDKFGIDVVEIE